MSLIVEDGTKVAGAESYCSVADASTYHTARGNSAWAALASDTVREQCLRKATAYMLQVYRLRWAGLRQHDDQLLDWPRLYVPKRDTVGGSSNWPNYYDADSVPADVRNACAELALRAATADLLADLGQMKRRVKVGPIETEYDPYSPQTKRYAAVDGMLAPYLGRASGGLLAVRS